MSMPTDIGVIDLMMNIPGEHTDKWYDFMRPLLLDQESREQFSMPAQYMFKDIPRIEGKEDFVAWTVQEMDRHGIGRAMLGIDDENEVTKEALRRFPGALLLLLRGESEQRHGRGAQDPPPAPRLRHQGGHGFSLGAVPAGTGQRQEVVPDLRGADRPRPAVLPLRGRAGSAPADGPAARRAAGRDLLVLPRAEVRHAPRLRAVDRARGEADAEVPEPALHDQRLRAAAYPKDIIEFANTRGAQKIIYAGYFPMGLSLERIFREMPEVPLRDEVWPLFLRDNAVRVFKL